MRTRPRLLADTTPLRGSRQYRMLFLNEGLAFLGSQITVVAVPLQVYLLTHSSLAVGVVGLTQVGQVAGPAAAGLIVARASFATAYTVDFATFTAAGLLALTLRRLPPGEGGTRAGVASVWEGLRFLRGRRALQGNFVIDLNAMVFGMPRALFPALGTGLFGGGP